MQRLRLRRAAPADVDAVRALTRAAYAKWVPLIGREPRPMTADHARAVVEHIVDLCEADGVLVGLIEMVPRPSHLLIENLAVHSDQQSRGIGKLLLSHAEDLARSLGLPELRLYTNAAFVSNIAFYIRRGFRESSRELVHMRKVLAP